MGLTLETICPAMTPPEILTGPLNCCAPDARRAWAGSVACGRMMAAAGISYRRDMAEAQVAAPSRTAAAMDVRREAAARVRFRLSVMTLFSRALASRIPIA